MAIENHLPVGELMLGELSEYEVEGYNAYITARKNGRQIAGGMMEAPDVLHVTTVADGDLVREIDATKHRDSIEVELRQAINHAESKISEL